MPNSTRSLGKMSYQDTVRVSLLEMVDDLAIISKCGTVTIVANSVAKTFIESKKLDLSKKKCHQMHIGKPKIKCS